MTGLVRKATLLSVCGLLAASVALAAVPDPTQSTCPAHINSAGHDGTDGEPLVEFNVQVNDISGIGVGGSVVVIDMSGCTDQVFCTDQLLNSTADCPTMTVRKNADPSGLATFRIIGGASYPTGVGDPGGPDKCVTIYADGVLLCTIDIGSFDLDNVTGVGGGDLSLWLDDFGVGGDIGRSDYDGDDNVGGGDLSLWLDVFGSASGQSCGDLAAASCGP
jgi:hypothetical protein